MSSPEKSRRDSAFGNFAFTFCKSLKSITISNRVTSIGDLAFDYCGRLTEIKIPHSVTEIGKNAFKNCPLLTVYYDGTLMEWKKMYPHIFMKALRKIS